MERHSLLTLSAIQTVAGKAIRTIKTGGKRETRNLLEVCMSFARRPQQQDFWSFLKAFVFSPDKQYQALLQRTACSVREDSLKALAVNFSCNAFSDERELLCRQAETGMENSWVQWLPPTENMQRAVNEWVKKGVSVFLLNGEDFKSCPDKLTRIPVQNSRCIFIYIISDADADFSWADKAAGANNICFFFTPQALERFAPWAKKRQLFYGVLRDYADFEDLQQERELLQHCIEQGCLTAVYRSAEGADDDELYKALKQQRIDGQLEILLYDLDRDTALIQDFLLGRQKIADYITA